MQSHLRIHLSALLALSAMFLIEGIIYEMSFTLCVLLVYNDNGSVQILCITLISTLCIKCLHRPLVITNQQYTKGEIHFIYLHYFHVFGLCFIVQDPRKNSSV